MSNPYDRAKGGKLTFKGGIAPLKSIDKKKKKKPKSKLGEEGIELELPGGVDGTPEEGGEMVGEIYTIDAAKRMKYDQLFPVEAKKFRYDGPSKSSSVEESLDDRVKKKADRYCK